MAGSQPWLRFTSTRASGNKQTNTSHRVLGSRWKTPSPCSPSPSTHQEAHQVKTQQEAAGSDGTGAACPRLSPGPRLLPRHLGRRGQAAATPRLPAAGLGARLPAAAAGTSPRAPAPPRAEVSAPAPPRAEVSCVRLRGGARGGGATARGSGRGGRGGVWDDLPFSSEKRRPLVLEGGRELLSFPIECGARGDPQT